jgi:chemotaxis response regulator CheB
MTPKPDSDGRPGLSRPVPVRVLVVEDFLPFRQFICSTLASLDGLQVIGDVSDGLEAVQKAQELQPDLILLGHRPPKSKRNRSRSTNSQGYPGI